ncbi:unnamed protein product [Arctogadus glacialis]
MSSTAKFASTQRGQAQSSLCVPFYTTSASEGTFHSQMTMMTTMMVINMTMNLAVWNRVDWHLGITLGIHILVNWHQQQGEERQWVHQEGEQGEEEL